MVYEGVEILRTFAIGSYNDSFYIAKSGEFGLNWPSSAWCGPTILLSADL